MKKWIFFAIITSNLNLLGSRHFNQYPPIATNSRDDDSQTNYRRNDHNYGNQQPPYNRHQAIPVQVVNDPASQQTPICFVFPNQQPNSIEQQRQPAKTEIIETLVAMNQQLFAENQQCKADAATQAKALKKEKEGWWRQINKAKWFIAGALTGFSFLLTCVTYQTEYMVHAPKLSKK